MQVVEMFREGCRMEAIAHARFGSQVEKDYICGQLGIEPYMLGWYGGVALKGLSLLSSSAVYPRFSFIPELALHHYINIRAQKALYCVREVQGEAEYEDCYATLAARVHWLSGNLSGEEYWGFCRERYSGSVLLQALQVRDLRVFDAQGKAEQISREELRLLQEHSEQACERPLGRKEEGELIRDQILTLYRLCYRFATGGLKP